MEASAGRLLKTETIGAYISVTRPKAIIPHLITAAAAMFLAAGGWPPLSELGFTLLGGAAIAAAANTFNSYLDRDIDAIMERTRNRPLPSGHMKPDRALVLGAGLGLSGTLLLISFVNWIPAVLAVVALAYYILPYTLWLKRRTYFGAVIGSGVGAITPFIGWMAVSPRITATPFLLAAVVIFWTIPHFWSLAVYRRTDYERAGLKVLPIKGAFTWIVSSSLLTLAASVLLAILAGLSIFYLGTVLVLGAGLLIMVIKMSRRESKQAARHLYRYSVVYIAIVFSAMIINTIVF